MKIAYIQNDLIWENPVENRKSFNALIDSVSVGTDLIVLPETFNTGFPVNPQKFAEPVDGQTMSWLHKKASEINCVVCGSLLLKIDQKFYNSFVWMRPDGSFDLYHKRHVFRIGGENKLVQSGDNELIIEYKGWKIKPMICYDLRFPVWSRNRYENGEYDYDLAIYVANFPAVRFNVWNQLLIARAIENQAFVLGVNRVGTDNSGMTYNGLSKLIDAKGIVVSEAKINACQVVENDIDLEELKRFRDKFNVGLDWDEFQKF